MARMRTNSARYFPFDVDYFNDRKIRRLKRECSDVGILIHIYLMCCVYSDNRGYCTEADENLMFDISERLNISEAEVLSIFGSILDIKLFDRGIYEKYGILTSHSVQLRFQEIVKKKAVKTPVAVEESYWLLDGSETKYFIIVTNSAKGDTDSVKNATNKIKEKEIKEKEIKAEEDLSAASALIKEYEACIGKASAGVREGIVRYLDAGMERELISRLIQYALEMGKCSWQYVQAAAEGNIAEGILTLEKYYKNRDKRAKKTAVKKSGFNNYTDTNKPDYSDMSEKIINEMLREAEEKGYGQKE